MSLRFLRFQFCGLCVPDINLIVASACIHRPYPKRGEAACVIPAEPIADVTLQIDTACICRKRVVPTGYRRAVERQTDAGTVAFCIADILADIKGGFGGLRFGRGRRFARFRRWNRFRRCWRFGCGNRVGCCGGFCGFCRLRRLCRRFRGTLRFGRRRYLGMMLSGSFRCGPRGFTRFAHRVGEFDYRLKRRCAFCRAVRFLWHGAFSRDR